MDDKSIFKLNHHEHNFSIGKAEILVLFKLLKPETSAKSSRGRIIFKKRLIFYSYKDTQNLITDWKSVTITLKLVNSHNIFKIKF